MNRKYAHIILGFGAWMFLLGDFTQKSSIGAPYGWIVFCIDCFLLIAYSIMFLIDED